MDKLEMHHLIMAAKARKGLSWDDLANAVGKAPVWLASVCYCLLYTSPSPRDRQKSRMPSSA